MVEDSVCGTSRVERSFKQMWWNAETRSWLITTINYHQREEQKYQGPGLAIPSSFYFCFPEDETTCRVFGYLQISKSFLYLDYVSHIFFKFIFLLFLRQGHTMKPCQAWNSLCRLSWPWTLKFDYLCFPSVGVRGVYHHNRWETYFYTNKNFLSKFNMLIECV